LKRDSQASRGADRQRSSGLVLLSIHGEGDSEQSNITTADLKNTSFVVPVAPMASIGCCMPAVCGTFLGLGMGQCR